MTKAGKAKDAVNGEAPDGSSSNDELHPGLESVGGAAGTGAGVGVGAVEAGAAGLGSNDGLQVEMASTVGDGGNQADATLRVRVGDSGDDDGAEDGRAQVNAAGASVGELEVDVLVGDARELS